MNDSTPRELARLLFAPDEKARDDAWAGFVDRYSDLLLRTVRSIEGNHDVAMDRYTFVLDQLRRDNFQRLRTYAGGRRAFATWLTVVARRLAIDHHRRIYGRVRETDDPVRAGIDRDSRKALAELISETDDFSRLPISEGDPLSTLRKRELDEALERALERLDQADRLLLVLRFEDERTGREIARIMNLASPFHAYRRLNRVFDRLRTELEEEGFDGSQP